MLTFEIEQYEIHVMKYRIEAEDEAQAIAGLFNGEAEPVEGSLEYVEVCEDLGLPTDDNVDLAEKLDAMGIAMDEAIIPSIRQVVRVE